MKLFRLLFNCTLLSLSDAEDSRRTKRDAPSGHAHRRPARFGQQLAARELTRRIRLLRRPLTGFGGLSLAAAGVITQYETDDHHTLIQGARVSDFSLKPVVQ